MNRMLTGLITATALTAAIPAVASAQTINERQANLFQRIEAGVQARQLTRVEADNLRSEFYALARLENDYRASAPGLTDWERSDLNRRFDDLSRMIRVDRNDGERGYGNNNWRTINERQDMLFTRISNSERNGRLTRAEADRLRADFYAIARLEEQYRRNGLTQSERDDLDRRLDLLTRRINDERRDAQGNYGNSFTQRIANLGAAIERAVRSGWLNNSETANLRARQRELANMEVRYRSGGYTVAERRDLDYRIDNLRVRLQADSGRDFGYLGGNYYR